MPQSATALIGILTILLLAYLLSNNRRKIRLRVIGPAFALQACVALLALRTPWGQSAIATLARAVSALLGYAQTGTEFLFGSPSDNPLVNTFALGALPAIIFFASLVSILYYLGIMQLAVRWLGGAIGWITGISRVEALAAASNIFVGQSESPLVIRPYLAGLTQAQLFTLMSVGMAGVAGTILAAYAGVVGAEYLPHILAATAMSAPGGILMAKIMMPDDPADLASANGKIELPAGRISGEGPAAVVEAGELPHEVNAAAHDHGEHPANIIEAAAQGAQTGLKLAAAVGAMVLSFVALVALANGLLGWAGGLIGIPDLTFQGLLGYVFAPIMFLIGIPWEEAQSAGGLFGAKIVLNELVAFVQLQELETGLLSERSRAIIIFALCGFANFVSIAIQIAVTGGLAPNQRPLIAKLGLRAVAAGSLANLMSAALAGLMLPA